MWKIIKNNSVFKYFFSNDDELKINNTVIKKKSIPFFEDTSEIQKYLPLKTKPIINILDTSSLLKKNFISIIKEGFFDNIFFVPSFVLEESHILSDSKNHLTRQKGKMILDNIIDLEKRNRCIVSKIKSSSKEDVDYQLIKLSYSIKNNLHLDAKIVTADNNLESLSYLENVSVMNINKFNFLLQQDIQKGDKINVFLSEKGDKNNQTRGNIKDGTLVIVDDSLEYIKQNVLVIVKKVWFTENTKIIFGNIDKSK